LTTSAEEGWPRLSGQQVSWALPSRFEVIAQGQPMNAAGIENIVLDNDVGPPEAGSGTGWCSRVKPENVTLADVLWPLRTVFL
jgi:hypothetical protein